MTSEDYFSKNHPFPSILGIPTLSEILRPIPPIKTSSEKTSEIDRLNEQILRLKKENIILTEDLKEAQQVIRDERISTVILCFVTALVVGLAVGWIR